MSSMSSRPCKLGQLCNSELLLGIGVFLFLNAWMLFAKGGSWCRDLQSYVSRLFLLVANESSKLVFIVDNGPWTSPEYRFRPAELWQLMVTQVSPPVQVFGEEIYLDFSLLMISLFFCWQSRVSPFANRRRKSSGDSSSRDGSSGVSSSAQESDSEHFSGWSKIRHSLRRQFKALPAVKRSPEGLHGCVVFEVEWANVRGINYLNELLVS